MEPISKKRWQQIEALLDQVLDLDAAARVALLDEACTDDPALRREVERLLRAEANAPTFLDGDAADHAGALLDTEDIPAEAGRRIGPYRVGPEIGRGGMGRVFRAERADGAFQQTVALKLLRPGLDSPDTERRFRAERQILASLDHPHIARLLGGGLTAAGHPYLAMEFIEGQPIDAFCDEQQLSIPERLRLFTTVGAAVHHAHRNLVVHRDLKPSNVFVTPEGEVKLLDFGIAKLLDDDTGPTTAPLTQTGQRWMTPEYAAPEQVRGEVITTATDVYQLGVVLYELLTGRRPFERNGGGLRGVEQAVLEAEPEKPSTAVSLVAGDTAAIGRARATEPRRLRRTLQGDLDTIVLKALSKEPEGRYASAEAFVEDIKRYLAGLPVEARRPTLGYRVRRFTERHRMGVAATAAVALALVAGLAAALWQAGVAAHERDQAEATALFLEDLLAAADPYAVERLDTLRVGALIDRGRAQVETELADRPTLQARLLTTIGGAYVGMHRLDDAEEVLKQALGLRRQHLGPRHEDTAETLVALTRARASRDGDSTVVAPLRQALAIQRERVGGQAPDVAMTMVRLARAVGARGNQGDFEEADSLFSVASEILHTAYPGPHRHTAFALSVWSMLREGTGDFEGAAALQRQALDMVRMIYGEDHPQTARLRSVHGTTLAYLGQSVEAERHLRAALDLERPLLGARHRYVLGGLADLALVLRQQGRYDEAETVLRDIIPSFSDPLHRAVTLGSLASVLREQGDLSGAVAAQEETLSLLRESLGPTHPMIPFSLAKLADILIEQRRYTEAERFLLDALQPLQAAHGDKDASVQAVLDKLVALYGTWGKPGQAAQYRAQLTTDPAERPAH